MWYKMRYESPAGTLWMEEKDGALTGLWIEGQKYYPDFLQGRAEENNHSQVLNRTRIWLDGYFRGERPETDGLALAPEGSEFRQEVWSILRKIPYGQTMTYGQIAQKIAAGRGLKKMSPQAVGGAVGHNPISIIIPCHRVIGTNGSLTGYAGGLEKKRQLLALEGVRFGD